MTYDPHRHHRRSIRLRGYDYSLVGAYYVTVVTQDRAGLFGEIANGMMRLNDAGRMVERTWLDLPIRFPTIELDAFIVMPNHIHCILVITDVGAGLVPALIPTPHPTNDVPVPHQANDVGAGLVPALIPTPSTSTSSVDEVEEKEEKRAGTRPAPTRAPILGDVIGAFKSITTHEYIQGVHRYGWQGFRGRVWQRNYYEHIIRDEPSLQRIRAYIDANPEQWASDRENPRATGQVKGR